MKAILSIVVMVLCGFILGGSSLLLALSQWIGQIMQALQIIGIG